MGQSVWMQEPRGEAQFPPLVGEQEADVAVVGGGITGTTTALLLAEQGLRVVLLEAAELGAANTGRSTGNLYGTVSRGLHALRDKWKPDDVRTVVAARLRAVDLVERIAPRLSRDCGFARVPLHAIVSDDDSERLEQLEREFDAMSEAGLAPKWCTSLREASVPVRRAIRIEGQAQINPWLYVRGLGALLAERGVRVAEHSPVVDVDAGEGQVRTERGQVHARSIVMATHSPVGFNAVQAEMQPFREYGISARLRSGAAPEGIFWVRGPQRSIRSQHGSDGDYLVIVGEKHKTGEPEEGVDYLQRLRDYASAHFDVESFVHGWSAQQFAPADGLPYVGPSAHRNVYIATGFASDGLTWGTVSAQVISEHVAEREGDIGRLITPWRFTAGKSARDWVAENAAVVKHLVGDRLGKAEVDAFAEVPAGQGRIMDIEGRKYAVHRASDGGLTVLSPVCTHLGCHVAWNGEADSWDCPCHGSRFHADGRVLEGPALSALKRFPLLED